MCFFDVDLLDTEISMLRFQCSVWGVGSPAFESLTVRGHGLSVSSILELRVGLRDVAIGHRSIQPHERRRHAHWQRS